MDVYMLDGNLDHSDLLLHALTAETLPHTLGMLVADMSRPWLILNSLQKCVRPAGARPSTWPQADPRLAVPTALF